MVHGKNSENDAYQECPVDDKSLNKIWEVGRKLDFQNVNSTQFRFKSCRCSQAGHMEKKSNFSC